MLRSLFQSRLSDPIQVGEEANQIRINLLLPIVVVSLIFMIASALVTLIFKEYRLLVAFTISAIILFVCFDLLRNKTLQVPAILFMIQGYVLITALLLFESVNQLSGIIFVIYYLMIAGMIFNPKGFALIFIYSAGLVFLMVSGIFPPIFRSLALPGWFSNQVSLVVAIGSIGLVGYLSYRALTQSLDIAVSANKIRDDVEQEKKKFESIVEQSPQSIFIKDDTSIYQSAVIGPLTDGSGDITHYVAYEDDITTRKEMAYKINELEKQLQENSGELTQLKEQLQDQSLRDRLTGLLNRVYLSEILPREILRSDRARNLLIFMTIDIDHFELINERYGHSTGDLVLQRFSKYITESIGRYDLAFRYGGDKFLLLFSTKKNEFGLTRAEELRKTFENDPIQCDGREILLTISIGIAVYPLHGKQEDEILTKAEKALEISRLSGGNRVTLWSENL